MVAVALSPNARALIQSGRNVHRPTTADRRRVGAALRARLGASVLPAETPVRDLLLSVGWQLPSGTALGLCLFGGALFFALRPASIVDSPPAPGQPPAAAFPTAVAVAPSAPPPVAAPPAPSPDSATEPSPKHPGTLIEPAPQSSDPLAQEVAMLSRAMGQLRSGRAALALSVLDEHQLRFPNGALSQERCAMRAQALCKLQRFREGRVELAALAPGSLAYERVQRFCAPAARATH